MDILIEVALISALVGGLFVATMLSPRRRAPWESESKPLYEAVFAGIINGMTYRLPCIRLTMYEHRWVIAGPFFICDIPVDQISSVRRWGSWVLSMGIEVTHSAPCRPASIRLYTSRPDDILKFVRHSWPSLAGNSKVSSQV